MRGKRWHLAFLFQFVWSGVFSADPAWTGEIKKGGQPVVLMNTSFGKIEIELDAVRAPKTTSNFLKYVEDGHYDGTIFHRVIEGFMIQGGGFMPGMKEKRGGGPIQNEADNSLKNLRGTIVMARTPDPHSATTQFFINLADNAFLDFKGKTPEGWGYAVFGKVTKGMDVVDRITKVQTGPKGIHQDVPREDVVIQSIKVQKP
jgi:peptidyl-prolyl cis-trans isomerase B (cyclophilin B)